MSFLNSLQSKRSCLFYRLIQLIMPSSLFSIYSKSAFIHSSVFSSRALSEKIKFPSNEKGSTSSQHLFSRKENNKDDGGNFSITSQQNEFVQSKSGSSTINLHLGQPSPCLLPMNIINEASFHRLTQNNTMILQYGFGQGYESFRKDLALFLSEKYGMTVSSDELMVSSGNSHAISLCCGMLCPNAGVVFVEDPSYFLAFNIFREQGAEIIPIRMDAEGIQVSEVERLIEKGKIPSVVYVIPAFHNPTGVCMSESRMERLVQLARQHNFIIVADEPYPLLNFEGTSIPLIAKHVPQGNVISLGSFSKILAPGLRLGWFHASPELIKRLLQSAVIRSGGCVNPMMAGVVHSAITLGYLEDNIKHLNAVYKRRKRTLCQALRDHIPELDFSEPFGGYFVWCKLPEGVQSSSLLEAARTRHGVSFTPGNRCSSKSSFEDYIRLSFAFYSEEELIEGVKRIKVALHSFTRKM